MLCCTRIVSKAIRMGARFILKEQDSAGLWRDYLLTPGPSLAWTTAWVAWSLSEVIPDEIAARHALQASRKALNSIRGEAGWGYNPKVAADADTTAWVLRVMAKLGDLCTRQATSYLQPFITERGGVRTFQRPERYGKWSQEHADVAPIAGLALIECKGDEILVKRLRNWCLSQQKENGSWASFWWSTDSYATAWTLAFLNSSGGIPAAVLERSHNWVARQEVAESAFELACRLLILVSVGQAAQLLCQRTVDTLQGLQLMDGGWPASSTLRVPHQQGDCALTPSYEDRKRLVSTAVATQSLKLWSSTRKSCVIA
jgi:hypothetical protein